MQDDDEAAAFSGVSAGLGSEYGSDGAVRNM